LKVKNEKSITELYKYHIKIIGILISFLIISIFALMLLNLNENHKDSTIINILGKQRMLTQMMSKDTGRIYEVRTVINGAVYYDKSQEELKAILSETIAEVKSSREEYDKQLNAIKKGYILTDKKPVGFKGALNDIEPYIIEHEKIWEDFKKAIDTVINKEHNSLEYLQAVGYINNNNKVLLNYSDQITTEVSNYISRKNLIIYYSVMIFSVIMILFLAIFIKKAYKSLFIPVSQLSKGAGELGLLIEDSQGVREEKTDFYPIFSEVKTIFNQFNSLILLMENLSKNIPFKDILSYIFNNFSEYIPYTYIGVALIDDNKNTITASYGVQGAHHKNLPARVLGSKVDLNHTSLARIVETGEERIINDLEEHVKGKPVKAYNKILLEEGIRASITYPLKNNDEVIGIIFFSSNAKNVYKKEHVRFLKTLANSIMLSLEKDILIEDMIISSTLALAKLTEERDNETGEHLQRMKIYSRMLAEFIAKEEKYKDFIDISYINDIERFSPLHDIGKVAIRDEILLKPAKLTEEEFEIMKAHAVYGAKVLRMAEENLNNKGRSIFRIAIEIAEGHHEKWNGRGYPYGKVGEEIPLSARIVALADVFDALTSERPYKKPFSFEESVKIIKEGSGSHFDPQLVDVFSKNLNDIKNKYLEFNSIKLDGIK
jgi:HD-GYP domain-containing protein (c-di-GMP phosphodiesterase class II)